MGRASSSLHLKELLVHSSTLILSFVYAFICTHIYLFHSLIHLLIHDSLIHFPIPVLQFCVCVCVCVGVGVCLCLLDDSGSMEEEDGEKEVKLVFRGLILRHQLVALLENKVFFNETDGVRSE